MNYQQQAQQWQALFRQKQQGSLLSRLLLWLVAGIMLVFAMGVLLVVLMLSWLLIPVLLYKRHQLRKQGKSFFRQAGQYQQSSSSETTGRVIEGEVLERKNDN
jgi:lipopolysaccharide/colanic/teichoic acid biosynthesis glycosyltransferase